ncbi:MAG: RNA 2',3'-cyclic phosphodiesterase [Firmicutes bacterium]|nr:RNA 2',3'-cyclic phosphodiesterase [Bacillota bacterium]
MKLKRMRVFLALELPAPIRLQLLRIQEGLSFLGQGVKWVKKENMHLTLYFLGNLTPEKIQGLSSCVQDVASSLKPFTLELGGLGHFPPRGKIRVLWAGIGAGSAELQALYTYLGEALGEFGFHIQRRAFTPHVTLGRLGSPRSIGYRLRAEEDMQREIVYGSFLVKEITLFQSILTPAGPIYKVVQRFALLGKQVERRR